MQTLIIYQDGKYYIGDKPLRCGKKVELLLDGHWFIGRIRYNCNYCFYSDGIGDIPLKEGMAIRVSSKS